MMKHLTTLAIAGTLGMFLLAGDAQACHKNKCNKSCAAPVACAPAPRPVQTVSCAPRQKKCGGGGLFACFQKKKSCAPAAAPCTTVAYNSAPTYGYGAPVASGQYPLTGTPQVPAKSLGTPQR